MTGAIPAELEGTLFRNGPGLLELGGKKLNQPFDGDGMVVRLALRGGRAHFKNAYVRTSAYVEEQAAGKWLYKGAFATGNPSGGWLYNPFDFSVKNVANTHVVQWPQRTAPGQPGRLWALWEGGLPHELDPATLATRGESNCVCLCPECCCDCRVLTPPSLAGDGAIAGTGPFAAHYRVLEGETDTFVNFGVKAAGQDAQVSFYEFDASAKLLRKQGLELPGAGFAFFHDFLVTDNYYILYQNPVKLDTTKLVRPYISSRSLIC